jgi:hypothetical protein
MTQFAKHSKKQEGDANCATLFLPENKYLTGLKIPRWGIGAQSAHQNALVPGKLTGKVLLKGMSREYLPFGSMPILCSAFSPTV